MGRPVGRSTAAVRSAHARARLPALRRRQPLLRGRRTPSPATSTRSMAKRCMQWAEVNGKQRLLVGGRINKFIPNPTFDPIAQPGSLEDYFRGPQHGWSRSEDHVRRARADLRAPAYRDRAARVGCSTSRAWTAPCCSRRSGSACRRPSRTTCPRSTPRSPRSTAGSMTTGGSTAATVGCTPRPMITLADPALAEAEVRRVLEAGARILVMVPGPVPDGDGYLSPGHTKFDRVWAHARRVRRPAGAARRAQRGSHYGKLWRTGAGGGGRRLRGLQARGLPAGGVRRTGASPTRSRR